MTLMPIARAEDRMARQARWRRRLRRGGMLAFVFFLIKGLAWLAAAAAAALALLR